MCLGRDLSQCQDMWRRWGARWKGHQTGRFLLGPHGGLRKPNAISGNAAQSLERKWLRVIKLALGVMISGNAADDVLSGNAADDGLIFPFDRGRTCSAEMPRPLVS